MDLPAGLLGRIVRYGVGCYRGVHAADGRHVLFDYLASSLYSYNRNGYTVGSHHRSIQSNTA